MKLNAFLLMTYFVFMQSFLQQRAYSNEMQFESSDRLDEILFGEPIDVEGVRIWPVVTIQVKAGKRGTVNAEAQIRSKSNVEGWNTLIFRTSYSHQISDAVSVAVGYATFMSDPWSEDLEHRFFQNLVLTQKIANWTLTFRTQFEQRVFALLDDTAHRLRFRLQASRPIDLKSKLWTFQTSLEIFTHLNEIAGQVPSGIDQFRAMIGIARRVGKKIRIQLNYVMVYRSFGGKRGLSLNHVFQPGVIVSL